ncbi:MAG: Hsp20/alpha crystallin family protein [Myxococcota bacterium]
MQQRGISPWSALQRLQEAMDGVYGRPFEGFERGLSGPGVSPAVNVFSAPTGFVFRLEVPGLTPESIRVETHGNTLRIGGKRDEETLAGTPHRRERWRGEFERAFTLPRDLDPAKATARYERGVLTVLIPRREEALPRQIQIEAA